MDNARTKVSEDVIVQLLYTQIRILDQVLKYIEAGNSINGYVDENIKSVEVDLRWLRKFCFNN